MLLGVFADGNEQLFCACGSMTCPLAGQQPKYQHRLPRHRRPIRNRRRLTKLRRRYCPRLPTAPSPALILGRGRAAVPAAGRSHPQRRHHQADQNAERPTRGGLPALHRSWPSSCLCVICSAATLAATYRPTAAISTMPDRGRWAPHTPSNLQLQVPKTPPDEDLLDRHRRLERHSATRRHADLDLARRHGLHHQTRQPACSSPPGM